ncbi:MAG: acyl-CoA thioesterase [Rhodospirillales bacterium]|nr:acyl-CoA thioesterase [Rhodospirillales bacterium]
MPAPHVTRQVLRFCDTDALGHVNNAVYSVMLEAGRSELALAAGLLDPAAGHTVVLVRLELDFLREITWPGEVTIETWVSHIGNKSARLSQRVLAGATESARASTVIAMLSTATRRAIPFTQAWRTALAPWTIPDAPTHDAAPRDGAQGTAAVQGSPGSVSR